MKKLSEILLEQRTIEVQTPPLHPTPLLVLFGDVLDPEKVLQSPEIEKLVGYCFGGTTLSIAQPENPEQLQDWLQEEQYKADVQSRAMTYPFKARFEDLTQNAYSDQYSGPLYVQIFSPGNTGHDVLTITCHWSDGLFRNDYYVIGGIIDGVSLAKESSRSAFD